MNSALTAMKLRNLRRSLGLSQAELARRAGISGPYLNLIESNKRRATQALLDRIAAGLGVARELLDGEAERRLAEELGEVAADPAFASVAASAADGADELVGRQPEWAELVLTLYRAYRDQQQSVIALADRLNHDPFLGESVHRLVTHVTSIRSAAEILEDQTAISPQDRERFLRIISSDSARLSDTAQALVAFFDNAKTRVRSATSMEHVDAFVFDTNNYFDGLERLAAEFRADCRPGEDVLAASVRMSGDGGVAERVRGGSPTSRQFELVRHALRERVESEIEAIVLAHPLLPTEEARALARASLASYAAAAALMPYDAFREAAQACRYDLDALCARFGVSYEQAAHRIATLRRPGAEGVRFAYMRSDPSGFVTKRLPLPGLSLPRYGTACPLWVVYGAFQTPGATIRSFGELPGGERFLFFARAIEKAAPTIGRPRHLLSIMLACAEDDAHLVAYGDGIDRRSGMVPVGTICRLCTRMECTARQEAPLMA